MAIEHRARCPRTGWRPDHPPRGAIYFPICDAPTIGARKMDDISIALNGVCRLSLRYASLERVPLMSPRITTQAAIATDRQTRITDPRPIQWGLQPLPQRQKNDRPTTTCCIFQTASILSAASFGYSFNRLTFYT